MAESELHPDVERRINEHLEAIDRVLMAKGRPLNERRSITADVEVQIRDMLASSGSGAPTMADLEALLGKLDTPESYAEEGDTGLSGETLMRPCPGLQPRSNASVARVMGGFITLVVAALAGWWFGRHYYRIGPEYLEPLVLISGAAAILLVGGLGLISLVQGIILLPAGRLTSQLGEARETRQDAICDDGRPSERNGPKARRVIHPCILVVGLLLALAGCVYCVSNTLLSPGILLLGIGALLLAGAWKPAITRLCLVVTAVIISLAAVYLFLQYRANMAQRAEQARVDEKMAKQYEEVRARERERWSRARKNRATVPFEKISLYPKQMSLLTKWMKARDSEEIRVVSFRELLAHEVDGGDFKWFSRAYPLPAVPSGSHLPTDSARISAIIRTPSCEMLTRSRAPTKMCYQIILTPSGEILTSMTVPSQPTWLKAQIQADADQLKKDLEAYYASIRDAE